MELILTGSRQLDNVRRFYFDAVGEDRLRQKISVGADLDLIRKYRIPLQELPLLCRRLLEARAKVETIMFTESDMVRYAEERAVAANALTERRRTRRSPLSGRPGEAWRGPLPPKVEE